jgi:hypothetical protein
MLPLPRTALPVAAVCLLAAFTGPLHAQIVINGGIANTDDSFHDGSGLFHYDYVDIHNTGGSTLQLNVVLNQGGISSNLAPYLARFDGTPSDYGWGTASTENGGFAQDLGSASTGAEVSLTTFNLLSGAHVTIYVASNGYTSGSNAFGDYELRIINSNNTSDPLSELSLSGTGAVPEPASAAVWLGILAAVGAGWQRRKARS